MKLPVPFIQLPLLFDASKLAAEVQALGDDAWRPHPQGYAGNWGLPLLSVNGDPDDDRTAGSMLPTSFLRQCPYTMQVLSALGAVWGRTRFMRLDGNAEVQAHVDNNYYWRERVRVHVPVVTRPDVRFECGDAHVNMAAGECWIFDTWRRHRVLNPSDFIRIHLVADTVGGEGFWRSIAAGKAHGQPSASWSPDYVPWSPDARATISTESFNRAKVMTPWEVRDSLSFIFSEARAQAELVNVRPLAVEFTRVWQALWAEYGDTDGGLVHYRAKADRFGAALQPFKGTIFLGNGIDLVTAIRSLVLIPSVMA